MYFSKCNYFYNKITIHIVINFFVIKSVFISGIAQFKFQTKCAKNWGIKKAISIETALNQTTN